MSRVINTDSPGKKRNQLMRTGAELVRHLSQKADIDDDAKNMLACLVFTLNELADGIEESTRAWEKRNYWIKIEEFQRNWDWTGVLGRELESVVIDGHWNQLPALMVRLLPHFSDIKVTKFTRKPILWHGAYERLLEANGESA